MDLNIGAALWFGARGRGTLHTTHHQPHGTLGAPPQAASTAVACRYAMGPAARMIGIAGASGRPAASGHCSASYSAGSIVCELRFADDDDDSPDGGRMSGHAAVHLGLRIQTKPPRAAEAAEEGARELVRRSPRAPHAAEPDSGGGDGNGGGGDGNGGGGDGNGGGGDAGGGGGGGGDDGNDGHDQMQAARHGTPSAPVEYQSGARVLLLGTGADEQLGGYGRHRTVFRHEGWEGLASELRAERERLWLRNLGRDDRMISDWAREARHPYLDEDVMAVLLGTPLHHICDLRAPQGQGDKAILRRLARMLGLSASTALQKRAIQFGTRIANKNVCGQAPIDDAVDLASVVHPEAESLSAVPASGVATPARGRRDRGNDRGDQGAVASRKGDAALPERLSKKRGCWASARAALPVDQRTRED